MSRPRDFPERRHSKGRGDVTAIVLAGGRSERFGGPKLAAAIDGRTVLDLALLAVDRVATAIIVAGDAPAKPPSLTARLREVGDRQPFAGPLAALSGALLLVDTPLAIVVGGDMPGLMPEVLLALLDRLGTHANLDAVILGAPGALAKTAVLPVALRVGPAIGAATATLAAGDRSLVRFLGRLTCEPLPATEWLPLDPGARSLLDVDTPADLDRLRGNEIR